MITAAEKQERRETIESVIGTHRAEGIVIPAPALRVMERFANGDLPLAEFSAEMDAEAVRFFEPAPVLAGAA